MADSEKSEDKKISRRDMLGKVLRYATAGTGILAIDLRNVVIEAGTGREYDAAMARASGQGRRRS